jgi:hypothetical protein
VAADSVSKPFESKVRYNHLTGFRVPGKAPYGDYQVRIRVWDRKGKPVAHNEEDFRVVPKKLKP